MTTLRGNFPRFSGVETGRRRRTRIARPYTDAPVLLARPLGRRRSSPALR